MGSIPMKTHQNDSCGLKNCSMIFGWAVCMIIILSVRWLPKGIGGTLGAVPQILVICLFLGDETTLVILGFLMRHRSIS